MKLNNNQLAAVSHVDGPCCVIAGAGSGKTAVLVSRVQKLINSGIPATRILAVTFSKKAASEMNSRIEQKLGKVAVTVSTFHSLGYSVLCSDNYRDKEPIREFQKIKFIKDAMAGTLLEEQEAAPKHISSFIGVLKSNLRKPNERPPECGQMPELNELYDIYAKYEDHKAQNNLYDFDDMCDKPVYLLRGDRALQAQLRGRWDHILVDEYQDTSPAQNELLGLLAPAGNNVFVVGDDYQSIYGFRGADVDNILSFPKRYSNVEMIYLDTNYRSTPEIVAASNALISYNTKQFKKDAHSGRAGTGNLPTCVFYDDEYAEANAITRKIKRMHQEGTPYKDIAILYRVNSVSRVFEEFFSLHDIPFKIQGGQNFFGQPYVADVVDYLRLAVNLDDSKALLRILNKPNRFFGQQFRAAVVGHMEKHKASALEAVLKNERAREWRYKKSVDALGNHLLQLNKKKNGSVTALLNYIFDDIGYKEFLRSDDSSDLYTERLESMNELVSLGCQYVCAEEFVSFADAQLDSYENNAMCEDAVTMSTVHKSKGLEYPTVFIVSCIDGMFPHKDAPDREEERRVMYVAMTRAADNLELSSIETRKGNRVFVSPFLQDINSYLNCVNAPSARTGSPALLIPPSSY